MTKITDHALKRMKERCGIHRSAAQRLSDKAYTDGISHGETNGRLNKYITALYFQECTANNIRIFADKVFIFNDNVLITVIPLPNNLKKQVNRIRSKKI